MPKRVKISAARANLFDLVQYVVNDPEGVVYIEHRDLDERVAMVREERLRYLESKLEELQERFQEPFKLAGSLEIIGDPEDVLTEVRADQARLFEEKLRKLYDD